MSDNTELTMMVGRKSISDCKKIDRNVKLKNKITGGYVAIRTQSIDTNTILLFDNNLRIRID